MTLALSLGGLGCRADNPGFNRGLGELSDEGVDTVEFVGEDAGASQRIEEHETGQGVFDVEVQTSMPGSSSTGLPDATTPDLETQAPGGDPQTEPETVIPQGTGDNPEPEVQDERTQKIQSYCGQGSVSCLVMDEVVEDQLQDQSPLARHIQAHGAGTVSIDQANYPFAKVVDLEDRIYESSEAFGNETDEIGFDVWLMIDPEQPVKWGSFDIDNHVSLKRLSNGQMECAFPKDQTVKSTVQADATLETGRLHHFACARKGSGDQPAELRIWVDGAMNQGEGIVNGVPLASTYNIGWRVEVPLVELFSVDPFRGSIGAVRVWHDLEKMQAAIDAIHTSSGF